MTCPRRAFHWTTQAAQPFRLLCQRPSLRMNLSCMYSGTSFSNRTRGQEDRGKGARSAGAFCSTPSASVLCDHEHVLMKALLPSEQAGSRAIQQRLHVATDSTAVMFISIKKPESMPGPCKCIQKLWSAKAILGVVWNEFISQCRLFHPREPQKHLESCRATLSGNGGCLELNEKCVLGYDVCIRQKQL